MSLISLPASIGTSAQVAVFEMVRSQGVSKFISGASQITSYPDRRWFCHLEIVPQFDADLRAWALALDQLSDRANWFALTPPYYDGPSTGYSSSNPLVAGGSQTGLTLDVDGLTPSAAILKAGDFISFDYTTASSNTNRMLNKVTQDATADGSGAATLNLLLPIRVAPANDATVNIQTPSALFMLSDPRSTVELLPPRYSSFAITAEERVFL